MLGSAGALEIEVTSGGGCLGNLSYIVGIASHDTPVGEDRTCYIELYASGSLFAYRCHQIGLSGDACVVEGVALS